MLLNCNDELHASIEFEIENDDDNNADDFDCILNIELLIII